LACKWRLQTRQLFETAFAAGYTAIDLFRQHRRNFYLLQKDWRLK
jgi:predicted GNAT superfamily acetyltransferase